MLGTLDIEEAAQKAAGNWQRFSSFIWWRERDIADADQWGIIYTHNRDSGLLDQSNAEFIRKAMECKDLFPKMLPSFGGFRLRSIAHFESDLTDRLIMPHVRRSTTTTTVWPSLEGYAMA